MRNAAVLIAYLILAALLLFCPLVKCGANQNYMAPSNTLAIKGFWVIVVFFSHYSSYVELSGKADLPFIWINSEIGQICVVMFLFYSGYGIWHSYQNKANYIKTFLKKRFFPTWVSFAICVLLFLIENMFLGIRYNFVDILFSFTGWNSIGNSNWYMFVTFALYILFFLCFRVFDNKNKKFGLTVYTALCLGLVAILYFTKESWWYNTLLCFPAGMWYAALKNRIDDLLFKRNKNYVLILILSIVLLAGTYFLQQWHGVFFIIYAICFCIFTVVVTMKLTFNSKPLSFIGKHVFSIYILQRLFFNLGQHYGLNERPYLFFALCLICTIMLAVLYDCVFDKYKQLLTK